MTNPVTLRDLPLPPTGRSGWPWTEEYRPEADSSIQPGSQSPQVTVVTPSFNQAEYIEETIRSVLLQGYPNLQYIVMDGGSTDGSVEVVKKYAPFLNHWESVSDRGQSHAINKGWAMATGTLLTWLCSDDVLLPGALLAAANHLALHRDAGMVYTAAEAFGDGRPTHITRPPPYSVRRLLVENYIAQPTTLIRRELLDAVGLLDENLHFCFDLEYWLRASAARDFVPLDRLNARFRFHPASKTVALLGHFRRERIQVLDEAFARFPDLAADARLVRKAYMDDLLYGAGINSVFSPVEQRESLSRLFYTRPSPTKMEVVRIVRAETDAMVAKSGVRADGRQETDPSLALDPLHVVRPLTENQIISYRKAARIDRRLRAEAILRRIPLLAGNLAGTGVSAQLLTAARLDPSVLLHRQWWEPARSTNFGRRSWPLFYGLRAVKRRLLQARF